MLEISSRPGARNGGIAFKAGDMGGARGLGKMRARGARSVGSAGGFGALTALAAVMGIAPSVSFLAPPSLPGSLGVPHARAKTSTMMAYDVRYSPNTWRGEEIEPGYGGVWPGDPDAKTYKVCRSGLLATSEVYYSLVHAP